MLKVSDLDLTKQIDWSKAIPAEDSYAAEREYIDPDDYQGWESVEYVLCAWEGWQYGVHQARIVLMRDPVNPNNVVVVYSDDCDHTVESWASFLSWCKEWAMGDDYKLVGLINDSSYRCEDEMYDAYPDECIVLAHRLS